MVYKWRKSWRSGQSSSASVQGTNYDPGIVMKWGMNVCRGDVHHSKICEPLNVYGAFQFSVKTAIPSLSKL